MKKTRAYLFFFYAFLLLISPLSFAGTYPAGNEAFGPLRNERNLPLAEGFGALRWGISVEAARMVCPDLREENSKIYNQYVKGKRGPDGVYAHYLRENEDLKVGGHTMDEIKYKFLEGKFTCVGMSVICYEDTPCKIEEIFQDIKKAVRNIYGKPYKISNITYEKDEIVKKKGGVVKEENIEWKIGDESISVTKHVEPKSSFITISIFSYQGYFNATRQER